MIFSKFPKSQIPIRNRRLGTLLRSKFNKQIYHWKAEIQGFPTVEESASEDITIKSYDPFEIIQKINKFHQKSQNSENIQFLPSGR